MSRQRIIERERRWRLPAALLALAALVLIFASIPVQQEAIDGTGPAEQSRSIHENPGTFLLASAMQGVALVFLVGPLLYLFCAAKARSDAVRGFFVFFMVAGPVLFGAQSAASGFASKDAAAEFVAVSAQASPTYQQLRKTLEDEPESIDRITLYEDADAADVEPDSEDPYTVELPAAPGSERDPAEGLEALAEEGDVETETLEEAEPGDAVAAAVARDRNTGSAAAVLALPALLALIAGIFYSALHGMRVGLLTRFFGTLGMALSVLLAFVVLFGLPGGLQVGLLSILVYIAALGVLIAGRWPGGRPPAWERGEAVPWPRPGEELDQGRENGRGDGEAVEIPGDSTSPHAERRARARKRKRKRRQ